MFVIDAELDEMLRFGATPYGERRVIGIAGGSVSGRLTGRILPGGADWQIIRADGAADIQARYTIESDGGGRVLVDSVGLRHGPPDVIARLARGEAVDPKLYYFRTAMRFETGDKQAGLKLWDAVIADGAADPVLRDTARLQWALHEVDAGDPAQVQARLAPLLNPDNPLHALAEETQALLSLRQGKTDDAKATFKRLSQDVTAPQGVRARAAGLLAQLGE